MPRSYRSAIAISRRVVVNLKTGAAIDGVLWDERGQLIVLRDANLHNDGGHAPLDGEIIIDRLNIDFVQVVS